MKTRNQKGQTFEIFGVVILAIAIMGLLFYFGASATKGSTASATEISKRHDLESFKAGVNSLLYTTEPKTGKTMTELLGISAKVGNTTVNFGPGVGDVDVKRELEWRFDAIYGKGKWYLRVPFPNLTADIEIVAVADTSGSMCPEIKDILEGAPYIIEELRAEGKNAKMTLFFLGTPDCCILNENNQPVRFNYREFYRETEYFHVRSIHDPKECDLCGGGSGATDEDWGRGLECAIESGPYQSTGGYGWGEFVVKLAIIVSDELPCSSRGTNTACSVTNLNRNRLDIGIKAAAENDIMVFPLKADGCIVIYQGSSCSRTDLSTGGQGICPCNKGVLVEYMEEIAEKTGGEMYELKSVADAASAIKDIIVSINVNRIPYLEAGTVPPKNKDLHVVTNLIPVTNLGKFVEVQVSSWS